jgi:hypothetical protein
MSCDRDILGTPYCDSNKSYPYFTEWFDGGLKSIVDDSLAVVATYKYKVECRDNGEHNVPYKSGLFLVNYRTKQKPLLGDTLELELELESRRLMVPAGDFIDSSLLVYDTKNGQFGFWKIGENSIKFINNNEIGIFNVKRANIWVNRKVMIYSNSPRIEGYILDTENAQIKRFDASEEDDWISQRSEEHESSCDVNEFPAYLSYIGGKTVCARWSHTRENYYELVVDGIVSDTVENFVNWIIGNYLSTTGGRIVKIDTESFKFDKAFSLEVIDNRFYKYHGSSDFVSYSVQDLIGAIKQ